MLQTVNVSPKDFQAYRGVIDNKLFDEIIHLAKQLRNKHVLYVNSNQNRGGVYEHLTSVIPLLQNLGIKAEWRAITEVPPDFYQVTKFVYNSIQGIDHPFTANEWKTYEAFNKKIAKEIKSDTWDFVLVQDHQMVASLSQTNNKGKAKWIWQSHSETHNPHKDFLTQFKKYLQLYDGIIFYLPEYIFKGLHNYKIIASTIAIDPLSPKNMHISKTEAQKTIKKFGINSNKPLVTQISRVDSWKDFPGVVDAWLLAKKKVPELQLALVGVVSLNNVHAKVIIDQILEKIKDQKGAYLLVNQVEREDIKAFQTASDVVLQKSLREGFGLTVSEALWSGTPVIGGNTGGIKVQIINGKCGYLVNNVQECAERIIELIKNPSKAKTMGNLGREHIRNNFLLPRLIRDELQLMVDLLNQK